MSGIYIPRVSVPADDTVLLRVYPEENGYYFVEKIDGIDQDFLGSYWAVSVPPHGRLIDADALHELFEYQWHHLQVLNWNGNPTAKARQSGINWCISTMRDSAPTIVPAEEGET